MLAGNTQFGRTTEEDDNEKRIDMSKIPTFFQVSSCFLLVFFILFLPIWVALSSGLTFLLERRYWYRGGINIGRKQNKESLVSKLSQLVQPLIFMNGSAIIQTRIRSSTTSQSSLFPRVSCFGGISGEGRKVCVYVQETNPNTKVLFLGGRERLSKSYELVIPLIRAASVI